MDLLRGKVSEKIPLALSYSFPSSVLWRQRSGNKLVSVALQNKASHPMGTESPLNLLEGSAFLATSFLFHIYIYIFVGFLLFFFFHFIPTS